jgi:hypothetical protein
MSEDKPEVHEEDNFPTDAKEQNKELREVIKG